MVRRALFFLTTIAVLSISEAHAADDVSAEVAFDEGLTALAANDLEKACPLFARAVDLSTKRPIGGLMKLGECLERQGKTASAWSAYREAAGLLVNQSSDARRDAAEAAVSRLTAVLRRVALEVDPVLAAREGLVVKIGDKVIPRQSFGLPLPVDPGVSTVRVELPGVEPRMLSVTLPQPGGTTTVGVEPWDEQPVDGGAVPTPRPPVVDDREETRFGGIGWAGIGAGTGGVALLGTALGLALASDGAYEDAIADPAHACDSGVCNRAGKVAVDDALALGDAATGVFIAGAVVTGAGLTLVIVDLATVEQKAPAEVRSMRLRLGMQGARIEGQF